MENISPQDVMNFGPEEREAYEEHLKWLRIEMNTLKKAEEKGFQKGIQPMHAEIAKNTIELARKMIENGIPIDQVMQITGLTEEAIRNIDVTYTQIT